MIGFLVIFLSGIIAIFLAGLLIFSYIESEERTAQAKKNRLEAGNYTLFLTGLTPSQSHLISEYARTVAAFHASYGNFIPKEWTSWT